MLDIPRRYRAAPTVRGRSHGPGTSSRAPPALRDPYDVPQGLAQPAGQEAQLDGTGPAVRQQVGGMAQQILRPAAHEARVDVHPVHGNPQPAPAHPSAPLLGDLVLVRLEVRAYQRAVLPARRPLAGAVDGGSCDVLAGVRVDAGGMPWPPSWALRTPPRLPMSKDF